MENNIFKSFFQLPDELPNYEEQDPDETVIDQTLHNNYIMQMNTIQRINSIQF